MDVSTIKNKNNRKFTCGYLGVFPENDHMLAEKMTYELLKPENKIALE